MTLIRSNQTRRRCAKATTNRHGDVTTLLLKRAAGVRAVLRVAPPHLSQPPPSPRLKRLDRGNIVRVDQVVRALLVHVRNVLAAPRLPLFALCSSMELN